MDEISISKILRDVASHEGYDSIEIRETPSIWDSVTVKIRDGNICVERSFSKHQLSNLKDDLLEQYIAEGLRLMFKDLEKEKEHERR